MRVNATHDHIRKCQALWYVAAVDRPCTDPDLDRAVSIYAKRFPGTLAVIITKTDSGITNALALDMKNNKGQSIGDFLELKEFIADRKAHLKTIRSKLKKAANIKKKNHLRDCEEGLLTEIDKLESEALECVVDARNSYIKTRLKKDKAKYLPEGADLPVYCVSNLHYAVCKGIVTKDGPLLNVNSTGILDLRSYTLGLAAPMLWESCKEMLQHRLKVHFHGIHGWAQNNPEKNNRGLPEIVKGASDLWELISDSSVEKTVGGFSEHVLQALRDNLGNSLEAAMRYFAEITDTSKWKSVSFLAFFRKSGRHSTRAVGEHSWNERFLEWQIKNVLDPAWNSWPNPQDSFDDGVKKVVASLNDATEELEAKPESIPLPMASFRTMLAGQIALIESTLLKNKRKYQEEYANIKLDACHDQYTGHFTRAMQPCYDFGKDDKGTSVCARVKNLLWEHLNYNEPLADATNKLEKAFKVVASSQELNLRTEIRQHLEETQRQFLLILCKESETSEETEARAKINEVLSELMPDIERIELGLQALEHSC
jgi:hypothetical protein